MKVVKALEFHVEKVQEFENRLKRNFPHIFYPIKVLDGNLYSVSVIDGKIIPSRRNYITYLFQYRERYHLIDIVTRQNLNELISTLDKEIEAIEECKQDLGLG